MRLLAQVSLFLVLLSSCNYETEKLNFREKNEDARFRKMVSCFLKMTRISGVSPSKIAKDKCFTYLHSKVNTSINRLLKEEQGFPFSFFNKNNKFDSQKNEPREISDFVKNAYKAYHDIENSSNTEFIPYKDAMGEVKVNSENLWGAQTQRSLENFRIGGEKNLMPIEVIRALAVVKKAAAITNFRQGILEKEKMELIQIVCDEILLGKLDRQFPLVVWQTGSGTQTNMNLNEVIANRANLLKNKLYPNSEFWIHPNDDVNKSQSSNDVFPTAMSIAAYKVTSEKLLPTLREFQKVLDNKSREFEHIIKIGRTHTMDATPLSLGMEFSAFSSQISHAIAQLEHSLKHTSELPIGGTAVGTGLNTLTNYDDIAVNEIIKLTGLPFLKAQNKFEAIASKDAMVELHGSYKLLSVGLMKIANDIRFLGSGPRAGLNELILPANEPGSSIMPGKINPTQCEALSMVCAQVMGNDMAVSVAGANGHFQLNTYKPMIIHNVLNSANLLADACESFHHKCLQECKANEVRIKENLENSLMLVTALNPHLGYDKTSQISIKAYHENISLKQAAIDLGYLTKEEYDKWVKIEDMLGPK